MNFLKSNFAAIIILSALISLQACKAKKAVQKPAPVAETPAPAPIAPPKPAPVAPPAPVPAPKAPALDLSTVKIQFEFDSSILRTDSYAILDQVAAEMKENPSVTYTLRGYASIEGTAEHNMALSVDRANSVKTYLINAGVKSTNIIAKGFGTSNPVADNSTDAGRILNRRVEVGN